jgi:hypothetical protein
MQLQNQWIEGTMGINKIIHHMRRAFGIKTLPRLDKELAGMERTFYAPPLTPELVAAIKMISPQFVLTSSEKCRTFWEADQNGACWGEYNALIPLFRSLPRPTKILEIGPGLGRSLVFFSKKLGWENSEIHAYEGEGDTTKYTILGPRFKDSFCGNISMLRCVLDYNAVNNVTIFNAGDIQIAELPGPYDFLYSFYSIGFHWSLRHFLGDILHVMDDKSVAVFTIPNKFSLFPELKDLSYKIVDWKTVWPKHGKLKMLVIGKTSIPSW